MRFALVILSSFLVFSLLPWLPAVAAQDFTVEEDLEFARGLMKRRMHDLAKGILDSIRSDPNSSDGEKASANLEIANLWKDKFGRGLTFEERIAASEEADKAYQSFVTDFKDHPRIIPAKFEYAEFLVYLGRYRTRLYEETLEIGGSQEEANKHRDIALEKLKRAADLFDELKVVIPQLPDSDEYAQILELSKYYRAILYYDLAKAEKDEASRMATFQEGINNLEDYIFENEDNLRGFRGYLYKGLCHREFTEANQRRDALACFEGVIFAFENVINNAGVGWDSWAEALADPGAKDLLENTYWHFAETLNQFGNHQRAIELVEQFKQIFRDAKQRPTNPGLRAWLEQAQAYFLMGKINEAIGIVSDVSTEAGTGNRFIQFHCDRLLAHFLDEVENKADLDPEVVFKAAKGAYGQDRFYDAIRHFQTVLSIKKGLGPEALECWDFIGRCYGQIGFERESALALATGAFRLKSVDEAKAMDLARRARNILARILKASGGAKEDQARLNKHKEMMDQVFGFDQGANFDPALQAMQEGKYEKAIEEFQRVDQKSEKYELAQAYITYCQYSLTERRFAEAAGKRLKKEERQAAEAARDEGYQQVIQAVDRYLAYTRTTPIRGEPARKANREQAIGIAMISKAVALKELKRWDEGLSVLDYFDSGLVTNRDHLEKASILKVQLLLGKKQLEAADLELGKLEAKYAQSAQKAIVSLKGQLGVEFKDLADRLEKKKDRVAALNALLKSVAYRHAWLQGVEPKIENLYSIAKDLYDLNRFDEAKSYLDAIMDRWGNVEKPRGKLQVTLRLARLYLARCLVWQGKYLEAEPILRGLHEERKKDLNLMKEYAELLTGTVRSVEGQFVYLPGRGADNNDAMKGYKLWGRIKKLAERDSGPDAIPNYLEASFHQDLVRWAQGQPENVQKHIEQLRVALTPTLDRKKGDRQPGHWEQRFNWLEKQVRGKAPQTPPPMPAPRGNLDLGGGKPAGK